MEVTSRQHGAVTVLKPEGSLDAAAAPALLSRVRGELERALGRVVLDASALPFMDSVGLESLVDLADEFEKVGLTLKVCAANETIREVLDLTGVGPRFEHFEDVSSAVRSFG
ncbi:MAG: anti-sigma factor antagonist [Phycisphaerales bacterium]|nr:MAG: anti-sigma factor antagonist [Phycisphaerales bacterium]